jgi:hypothetical protein
MSEYDNTGSGIGSRLRPGWPSGTSCCQRVCRRCHPGLHTSKKQTKQTAEENKGKQIIIFHNYTGGASIATTQHGTQLVNERKTIGLSAKCIPQMKTSKYANFSPIDEISMESISKPASDFVASEILAARDKISEEARPFQKFNMTQFGKVRLAAFKTKLLSENSHECC